MLKADIKVYKNVDIGKYSKLTGYLESQSKGIQAKKAVVLDSMQIEECFTKAWDKEHLMIKVALIVSGVCRCCELTN
ncbi:hypothetical protein NQ317_009221 [Molorchus minor]|uniref:Uncharacterized protein n=1 Tax=Molorchus minor TaxID=1323400 RepID=A0ABQ9J851_9CUCU|nr:hypothetical protein NQ317_009221 [Molorchus minor]